jgi:hypothetical protein
MRDRKMIVHYLTSCIIKLLNSGAFKIYYQPVFTERKGILENAAQEGLYRTKSRQPHRGKDEIRITMGEHSAGRW